MRVRLAVALLVVLTGPVPLLAGIAGKPPAHPVPRVDPFTGDSRLPGPAISRDLRDIDNRLERRRDAGALTKSEVRRLRREQRVIRSLARRYRRDGLSESERSELDARARYLRDAVNRPSPTPSATAAPIRPR